MATRLVPRTTSLTGTVQRSRRRIINGRRSNSAVGIPSDSMMRRASKQTKGIFAQLSRLSHTGSSGRGQG